MIFFCWKNFESRYPSFFTDEISQWKIEIFVLNWAVTSLKTFCSFELQYLRFDCFHARRFRFWDLGFKIQSNIGKIHLIQTPRQHCDLNRSPNRVARDARRTLEKQVHRTVTKHCEVWRRYPNTREHDRGYVETSFVRKSRRVMLEHQNKHFT